ncbi:MAG: nicotinamide mononucleotide transporter [Clostridia bacterium]|nr:nicotinamide mononucleotide transporter [Clostridia bacterium]
MKILNLSGFEKTLYAVSVSVIIISSILSGNFNVANTPCSVLGATALIFVSKGNPIGQLFTVIFGIIYAIISFRLRLLSEVITYASMTAPIALIAFITWLKNPYEKNEVKIAKLTKGKIIGLIASAIPVTVLMCLLMLKLNTPYIVLSTVSIFTSYIAAYLTVCRSPYYAFGYLLNDIVLIILWSLAAKKDLSYISIVACFVIFLANDLYGLYNWERLRKKQGILLDK